MDKYDNYEAFAKMLSSTLSALRVDNNVTQRELAARLGVSKTYIGDMERGKTKVPAYILYRYCLEFHTSIDNLLKLTDGGKDEKAFSLYNELNEENRKLALEIMELMLKNQ